MLNISQNNRYIEKDGIFFPYLADTAWTIAQLLSREDVIYYLDKRKSQGFNAIQFSVISELGGITSPNVEGLKPFYNDDVTKPDIKYFKFIRFIVEECAKRDLVAVVLPYWGDKFNLKWGTGPEVFTSQNSYDYGKYLAEIIGDFENLIWMLGGDRPLENSEHIAIIDETARGLKDGEKVRHLMTYHPNGEKSSYQFLPDRSYIDFHSIQSSHSFGGYKSEILLKKTLNATKKPCLDAECFYEDFPMDFNISWNYRFSDSDIRKRIYRNMFQGAAGHTYGHQSVWCFNTAKNDEYLYTWREALDRPMAYQMQYVNKFLSLIDITSTVICKNVVGAFGRKGKDFYIFYSENKEPFFVRWKKSEKFSKFIWYNTKNGECVEATPLKDEVATFISPFDEESILMCKK